MLANSSQLANLSSNPLLQRSGFFRGYWPHVKSRNASRKNSQSGLGQSSGHQADETAPNQLRAASEDPALPVLAADELRGLRRVPDLHPFRIPLNPLSDPVSDRSEVV